MDRSQDTNWSSKYFLAFIFGGVTGTLVSSFVFVQTLVSLLVLIVGAAIFVGEKIYNRKISQEIIFLSLILTSFGLGSLRYAVKDFHESIAPSNTGIVVSEPEQKDNTTRYVVLADNGEKVLVNADLYSPVRYGDRVEVRGKFKTPGIIVDEDSGKEFDYGKYLSKDDIYYTLSFAEIKIISHDHGNTIKSALFKLKRNFIQHAKSILAEPYASLLMGLIVSGREALPADILEEFRRAGVIHIVVLSGYNITLIAEFLRRSLEKFLLFTKIRVVPQAAAGASIIGIILFVLMTGAQATVVRAAIMALTVIAAKLFGRNYSASRALLVAGFLMLLENPKILVFDPSFQLSFLATLGLIYVMPIMERKLNWVTERFELKETLAQTLSTQVTVLPLLIYMSGDVSLVSLPANLLILVTVPYTMLVGFLAVMVSYISSIVAWPLTYISYLLLSWILFVAHTLGTLKFATMGASLPIWIIILIYLILFSLITFGSRLKSSLHKFAN